MHSENDIEIVCFSFDPWSFLWKRKQKLLYEISQNAYVNNVLYVEPATTITELLENSKYIFKNHIKKITYRNALRVLASNVEDDFFLLSPTYPVPGNESFKIINKLNKLFWEWQVNLSIKKIFKQSNYVLWLYHPNQIEFINHFSYQSNLIVYDWTDDWVMSFPENRPEGEKDRLQKNHHKILKEADIIFAVSKDLTNRAKIVNNNVYYLPNATDNNIFKPNKDNHFVPYLRNIQGTKLIYLSQITPRVNFKLLEEVAYYNNNWKILLVGPIVCPESYVASLRNYENIIFFGAINYSDAATMVSQSDVCLLPHKMESLTYTLDPIKLYDYLATGRPIVSTNVAMHEELKQHIYVANSSSEFIDAINSALNEPNICIQNRLKAAKKHTWKTRAEEAISYLTKFV